MVSERVPDRRSRPDERNLRVEMTRGGHGAVDDGRRRVVTTHRVNGDADHEGKWVLTPDSQFPIPRRLGVGSWELGVDSQTAYSSLTGRTWRWL